MPDSCELASWHCRLDLSSAARRHSCRAPQLPLQEQQYTAKQVAAVETELQKWNAQSAKIEVGFPPSPQTFSSTALTSCP